MHLLLAHLAHLNRQIIPFRPTLCSTQAPYRLFWVWIRWSLVSIVIHVLFWAVLIFLYPRFRGIQSFFFWNRWTRRIFGLVYVDVLLTYVPFLRRRLFTPFVDKLLADAEIDDLPNDAEYYPDVEVLSKESPNGFPIGRLPDFVCLDRVVVVEGESGLGKTWFLRRLVRDSQDTLTVFLRASRCHNGVINAIQDKLEGSAKDSEYLARIIYGGKINIIIDGLNEVSAVTRAHVTIFAEKFSKSRLIVATQPMIWDPPKPARTYVVQRLSEDRLEEFLETRLTGMETRLVLKSLAALKKRSRAFLREAIGPEVPDVLRKYNLDVLCNPMDLSVVAEILTRGEVPDLHKLMDHYYNVMAIDYSRLNQGREFPLREFSNRVYEMRCSDEDEFDLSEFEDELNFMSDHRMVVARQHTGGAISTWRFRHEKIMDYFIVHAFLGRDNRLPEKHLSDMRFSGVYFLLALLMPLSEAAELRERLIFYAADTKDHFISDRFVQNLRSRALAEG